MGIHDISRSTKPMTFAQWQGFRRQNPRLYYNAATQNKVARDIEVLGTEAFFAEGKQD